MDYESLALMEVSLETERLRLRRFTTSDADLLIELDGDPEVMQFLTGGRATAREVIESVKPCRSSWNTTHGLTLSAIGPQRRGPAVSSLGGSRWSMPPSGFAMCGR